MSSEFILSFERDEKRSVIMERNNRYEVDFFNADTKQVWTIAYDDKSLHYVEDAAYNFISGVMTEETLEHYNIRKLTIQ